MMSDIQAQDEVFGIANAAWNAAIVGLTLGYTPKIYFPGKVVVTPDPTQIYAECNLRIVLANQANLADFNQQTTNDNIGLISIQIYSPKQSGAAYRIAQVIGAAIKNAYCKPSPSGQIWFRGQRLSPVDGNETRNQVNVVVGCTYRSLQG